MNTSPCKPSRKHYRDMNRQNNWIRENLFDPMGNYLSCSKCVCAPLSISKQKLSQQRDIKRLNAHDPIVDMTKEDVEGQHLGDFVVMPTSVDMSFLKWWRSVDVGDIVQVRYPHQRTCRKAVSLFKAESTRRFLGICRCQHLPRRSWYPSLDLLSFQYSIKHSLTKSAFSKLLQLFKVHLPTAGQYPRSVRQVKAFFMDLFPHTSPLVHEYCKYCLTALPPDDGTCATLNCPGTGKGQ